MSGLCATEQPPFKKALHACHCSLTHFRGRPKTHAMTDERLQVGLPEGFSALLH